MKVKEIMTQSAVCCGANMNIGEAVELMWVHNCGMLPVVGADRKLSGIITDRDISIAVDTRTSWRANLPLVKSPLHCWHGVEACKPARPDTAKPKP